jgi:hypothetical protein
VEPKSRFDPVVYSYPTNNGIRHKKIVGDVTFSTIKDLQNCKSSEPPPSNSTPDIPTKNVCSEEGKNAAGGFGPMHFGAFLGVGLLVAGYIYKTYSGHGTAQSKGLDTDSNQSDIHVIAPSQPTTIANQEAAVHKDSKEVKARRVHSMSRSRPVERPFSSRD